MNKVFISNCFTCKYNNYWVLEIVLNKDICLEHFLANFNVKTCDMTIQVSYYMKIIHQSVTFG